ncbi:hypothetical protein P0W64_02090 [Tsukamurella sp. 8F]|uniref:hypothetical protein n=1 Tax=unclassified Tsukamurella TaxID=2633480 RepID=UPI0023BA2A28|nr:MULTISPECIES: hypothetical protein [unclassified Tsukamurella]MDF0528599.1 hypothetical protein [Tsukamurella sp. 8J]MDF0585561.1 hypothetical protein [Tsukamurella sp. 8F]
MSSSHITEIEGVTEILDTLALWTFEQTTKASGVETAKPEVRQSAVELASALYDAAAVVELKKSIEQAVAPLELGGPASEHVSLLAGDAALAAILLAQDAGHDMAGGLEAPWKSVVAA